MLPCIRSLFAVLTLKLLSFHVYRSTTFKTEIKVPLLQAIRGKINALGGSICRGNQKSPSLPLSKKIIKSPLPHEPEKAEIEVKDADPLYQEVRIENSMEDQAGNKVKLKEGADVSVTIEADVDQTVPKHGKK